MRNDDPKYLARVENVFVEKAHYQLPAPHQKILLYAIANIDPNQDDSPTVDLSMRDMEKLLEMGGKKRNYDYKYINGLFRKLIDIKFFFDSPFEYKGGKLEGGFTLIQHYEPTSKNGQLYMTVDFSKKSKLFLLRLQHYVQINILEVAYMKSGHAIRLFQALKAIRNKQRSHHKVSIIPYELEELKKLLGVQGKYSAYKDFNKRVLKRAILEINENTSINIKKVDRIKGANRRVAQIIFHIADQDTPHGTTSNALPLLEMQTEAQKKATKRPLSPTQADIDELTKAQWTAYYFLMDIHIYSSIAMTMVKNIKGTVAKGYEDVFIKYAWDNFLIRTTKYQNINETDKQQQEARAGAFRQWWNQDCFNPSGQGLWSNIIEQIQSYKKSIATTEVYANRELAKGMSRNEFVKYYRAGGIAKNRI